jgi:cellulose synthase/poly-beta-1,6-N-acetylglucosamine synthase-like glycosyltransferase
MTAIALAVITLTSPLLFVYGANLVHLSWRALSLRAGRSPAPSGGPEPLVAVQIPVYNERYVAERVINAACSLEWPRRSLEIQVLDDSDDETVNRVREAVERWRRRGLTISHLRRSARTGYKAGALAEALAQTRAPFLAIFDADFLPPPDFLRRTMATFEDPRLAYVQARWDHLNESYSWFTRLQALMIDFHFLVEQPVRAACAYPTNFAGSAGVWRRAAVEDAGGWSSKTLTEDLELSYRAQLKGWRAAYLEEVTVRQELPVTVNAYRAQQSRWAQGSFQSAFRLLGPLLRSRLSAAAKLQGALHLLGYAAPVLMLLQIAAYPALLWAARGPGELSHLVRLPLAVSLMSLAPLAGFAVAQHRRGRPWWPQLPGIFLWAVVGSGTSLAVVLSLLRALREGGEFRRTPKYRIERPGQEWASAAYATAVEPMALAELVLGLAACALTLMALDRHEWLLAAYSTLFASGFLCLGIGSLGQALEVVSLRRLGRNLPARLYRLGPSPLLLVLPAAVLAAVAQLPDPFEDSYQHWLMAATLAQTGHLRDPLFGMQDTWLPGYQLLAAGALRVTGLWSLWSLKLLNVGLGLVTLVLVYRLAGSRRRGRLAMALLALNPIFLLTATTAVAEPLLVASLLGAVAALRRGKAWVAALLAVIACLTGTKAWLWLLALAAVLLVGWARTPRWTPLRQRLAWVAPALVLAGLLQATLGFASNSAARGALEAASAASRGSLPATGTARGAQFVWYLVVASLPILLLAPLGLATTLRGARGAGQADGGEGMLLRVLHLPSLLYLASVTALVTAGLYSGSHRYYYPALPALALLAAAALDRYAAPIAAVAIATAGVVAIAFVPIFSGLAADNRGLVAAGRAASPLPGALVTDSPVAAYWSHKPPTDIYGSRQLPLDPVQASAWLRARQVGGVVSEDIDYYRLGAVFPGLPLGRAQSGFQLLGDQSGYNVAGGKRVFVYELSGTHSRAPLGNGLALASDAAAGPGAGKSARIAKGPVLIVDGASVAGEGVGFGVPAVHDGEGWHYPGSAETVDLSAGDGVAWRRTYDLSLASGDAGRWYPLRPAASRGRVSVTYRVTGSSVRIQVATPDLAPGWDQIVLLNEESSQFDDLADATRTGSAGLGPWQPIHGDWARLRSNGLHAEWELPAPPPGAELMAGRELQPPDLDWSGLEYRFGPPFQGFTYDVNVRRSG